MWFGTSPTLSFQGRIASTSFSPGALTSNTTYYWRVDEVNPSGVRRGFTWRFTTQ
ncbi:MAG: hypothetical protein GY711_35540 [bacterium]|nr:hypothetical protein [bacterium]